MPRSTDASTIGLDQKLAESDVDKSLQKDDSHVESLPYWLVNVPRSQWPVECPSFLRDLPLKSIETLSTPDELYERQSWETVKDIIS